VATSSGSEFFDAWKRVCSHRKDTLLALWDRRPNYTSEIFYIENSVVAELASGFPLQAYCDYYSLDAIFFEKADRVHCCPLGQTWVQNVRVAFEHEHSFRSGLFKEVSHLCITRAELRVLVTYPEGNPLEAELEALARIISEANLPESETSFLIITGARIESDTDIEWSAHTYEARRFIELKQ